MGNRYSQAKWIRHQVHVTTSRPERTKGKPPEGDARLGDEPCFLAAMTTDPLEVRIVGARAQ